MIREKVKIENFFSIAKQHEYFLWHFLQKDQHLNRLAIYSIFDSVNQDVLHVNHLNYILDKVDIPYFESYTEESIEFLMGLGYKGTYLFRPTYSEKIFHRREFFYNPILIGFNKFKYVKSTSEKCYCSDIIIDILYTLNPKFILDSNFD